MRVYIDIESSEELVRYLQDNTWSGARDRIKSLDYETLLKKCDTLLECIEECSQTELNDEIWFGDLFNEEEEDEEDEEDEEVEYETIRGIDTTDSTDSNISSNLKAK